MKVVLTSKLVYEGISSVLECITDSDMDAAKKKLETLAPEVKTERERGSVMAASGIYSSMTKAKDGTLQTWAPDRVERVAASIRQNQMADEFDAGYADTLLGFSKLMQSKQSK